jgi:hypothetical protein
MASRQFRELAPRIVSDLVRDEGLTPEQAAGIVGNFGHETGGFKHMQEISPVVRGSKGGWGWAQWTGPRRTAFMSFAKANGLEPDSYEANYRFLTEGDPEWDDAVAAVKNTATTKDAARAFERSFERAGVKAFGSRQRYANQALATYQEDPYAFSPVDMPAIMDVAQLNDGSGTVPDQPTTLQGFNPPDLSAMAFAAPPQPPAQQAIADMLAKQNGDLTADQIDQLTMVDEQGNYLTPPPSPPPMPEMPPQWASATGFPEVPRRPGPGGALGVDLGTQPAGMPIPQSRPEGRWMAGAGGAPDASAVPMPGISPMRPAMGGPNDRQPQPPTPPSRASGLPNPPPRPDINDPSLSFNAPPYAGGGPTSGPPMPAGLQSMIAGREEFPGALPAAPRMGDMSAAMGNAPPPPAPPPPAPHITSGTMDSLGLAQDLNSARTWQDWQTGELRPQADAPWGPTVAGRPEFPGGGMPPAEGPFFDNADPGETFTPPAPAGTSFNIPPSPWDGTTGENFTPAPPMPTPPAPNMMADRFSDAFSPGGGGQIMDLPSIYAARNAPPTPPALSAPPMPAQPPIGPTPAYADDTWIGGGSGTNYSNGLADKLSPPTPRYDPLSSANPGVPPGIIGSFQEKDWSTPPSAMETSVVRPPTPVPSGAGVTVVNGATWAGGIPYAEEPPPAQTSLLTPPPAPRSTSAPAGQRNGIMGRILGGLLGGPLGAAGGGLLGGGGFGFNQGSAFSPYTGGPMMNTRMGSFRASGSAPNASGGKTNFQHGTAFNGSSPATTFTTNGGRTYTYTTDPITGAPIGGFV